MSAFTFRPPSKANSRFRGERGIAIVMTALVLVPLMVFASYGVDLASFYSRVSQLQRAADSAALAGTVWMPDFSKAQAEAAKSLAKNGFTNGVDGIVVSYAQGARLNSLAVTLEDTSVTTYFSKVIGHRQAIVRSAEAQYNLPLPLGSPLNYFGGDTTRTGSREVSFPPDYSTVRPLNYGCNIGASTRENLGRWMNDGSWRSNYHYTGGGADECIWGATGAPDSGTTSVAPPDYRTRAPLANAPGARPCNVFGTNPLAGDTGRWTTGGTYEAANYTGAPSAGNRPCVWENYKTVGLPSYATTSAPMNSPCNIGYADVLGRWNGATFDGSQRFTRMWSAGNQLCRWGLSFNAVNPIAAGRSPGFWAAIEGPDTRAIQGDAFSTRCWGASSGCSTVQNNMYQDPSDVERGYWYIVKVPASGSGTIDINVFDAAYNTGSTEDYAGDRSLDNGGSFPTKFTVYKQTHRLDFSQRAAVSGCSVTVTSDADYTRKWKNLCQVTASGGDIFQVNVQTTGTSGAGVNGYALEAVRNGSHANPSQPALYAYSAMQMQNNNFCEGTGCTPPPATFYIAEVGPQYAGKKLVMELWDPGDVSGTATMYPMMPATSSTSPADPNRPRPVVPVPSSRCTFTADSAPNPRVSGVGTQYTTPQPPDVANCGIRTSTGGGARFNGEWLRIRIDVPSDYTCTVGVNPETNGGSCWWGIRYEFGASANDVTTWQARIEGNPVHLTE